MTDFPSEQDLVGQRIGPYLLEGRLGSGGMGYVFQAWDERLHRRVALKQIKPEVAGDARNRERFRREARAAAALNHPAIVQIHDLLEREDGDWIVMEMVEGETLAERVSQRGPLDMEMLLDIGTQIAEALAEAHDRGIVHRDLKTENVILTPAGKAKVLDFGLAKRLWSSESEASISVDGRVLGTLRAMSPEQAMGVELDGRSDLFSLGVLLYEASTAESPFRAKGPAQTLTRVIQHDPLPPTEFNDALSGELSDFILHLLAKRPEQRPASAHRVGNHLLLLRGGSAWGSLPPSVFSAASDRDGEVSEPGATGRPGSSTHLPTSTLPAAGRLVDAGAGATEVVGPSASRNFAVSGPGAGPPSYTDISTKENPAGQGGGWRGGGTGTLGPTAETMLLPTMAPPRRWPRWLAGALLALVVAAALAGAIAWWLSQPAPPLYVAVPQVRLAGTGGVSQRAEVAVDGAEAGSVLEAEAVRYAALRALTSLEEVYPLPPSEVDALQADGEDVAALARQTAADEVLVAELACRPVDCRLTLSRVRGSDGGLLWTDSFPVPVDEMATLDRIVRARVIRGYASRKSGGTVPPLEVSAVEYERFLRLRRGLRLEAGATVVSRDEIAGELQEILASAPDFFEARLLAADVARLRYFEGSRDPAELTYLRRQLAIARELAPRDPAPLHALFTVQLQNGELLEAAVTLGRLEELAPGEVRLLRHRALLLREQGKVSEALETMESAVERQPSWRNLMDLALLQTRAGALDAARSTLERLLGLVPGYFDALSLLAQLELTNGSVERAETLYTQLVARSPESAERANLGLAQMLLGHFDDAVESYRQLADEAPDNSTMLVNLADAHLLQGDREAAARVYRRILEVTGEVPEVFEERLTRAQALAHLGRDREAAEAITTALAQHPDDPQVAYTAALVYTLIGERSSALVHARHAMEGGFGERWFGFPWFDPLREEGELAALVRQTQADAS